MAPLEVLAKVIVVTGSSTPDLLLLSPHVAVSRPTPARSASVNGASLALSITSEARPDDTPTDTAGSMNLAGNFPRRAPLRAVATSLPAARLLLEPAVTALR